MYSINSRLNQISCIVPHRIDRIHSVYNKFTSYVCSYRCHKDYIMLENENNDLSVLTEFHSKNLSNLILEDSFGYRIFSAA